MQDIRKLMIAWVGPRLRVLVRDKLDRRRLTNKDFSIISSNCIGGVICHDLGQRFLSPTVNLYFDAKDYINFLENIHYYLNCELEFLEQREVTYPVGRLDDIKIYFFHYKNNEDAKEKWNERKKRLNFNNLFIIMTDRDGCTKELIKRFDRLPYKNKIIFTAKPYPDIQSVVYVPGYEQENSVGLLTSIISITGTRAFAKKFNYIDWLNIRIRKQIE
jgi:uncharacterized protein (DUF1919 family)